MGLDMYLTAETYVSGWEFLDEKSRAGYRKALSAAGLTKAAADPDSPSATISVTVAYWRKANQIHAWFVENVQGGEDKCNTHRVEREQLVELRDLCKRVLASTHLSPGLIANGYVITKEGTSPIFEEGGMVVDSSVAEELLPNRSGFFFGSTDYDEYYVRDLEDTIKMLDRVLKHTPPDADFEYRASW